MDVISLTKDLVHIPSARSTIGKNGPIEADIALFIEQTLQQALPPSWHIERQPVAKGRDNLFVHDGDPIKFLLVGHMDTVEAGGDWTTNVLGHEKEGYFYGRGAADMKSGVAVLITTLMRAAAHNIPGVAALFYCDEEYEFLGMKQFIKDNKKPETLQLVMCPEPTSLGIRQGVRGDFEYRLIIQGKRGHAARPQSGVNAYRAFAAAVAAVDECCARITNNTLGTPTVNVAGVSCGTFQGKGAAGNAVVSHEGNVIPDYCKGTIEVRVVPEVTHEMLQQAMRSAIESVGAQLVDLQTPFFVGSYLTDKHHLQLLEQAQQTVLGNIQYDDPAKGGYSDIQLIAEAWNVPCALLGPTGTNMHAADEAVDFESIKKTEQIYHALIDTLQR